MTPSLSPAPLGLVDDEAPTAFGLVEPKWTTRKGLLRISSNNDAGHWTLELDGELDLSNADALDGEIRLAETCAETITVDLRGLSFIDSSGLYVLLDAQARSRPVGRLRLRKGPRAVQRVFRLTGTEDDLPFVT